MTRHLRGYMLANQDASDSVSGRDAEIAAALSELAIAESR